MALDILDISEYQPNVDYGKATKACSGVILRCGGTYYGSSKAQYIDDCFADHYAGFRKQGAKIGAYFYAGAVTEAGVKAEIEKCLSQLKGKTFELPIFYDIEAPGDYQALAPKEKARLAKMWCQGIEAAGYRAGIYIGLNYAQNYIDMSVLADYPLWMAQYNKTLDWTGNAAALWQNTSTGKIDGISGNVDLSKVLSDSIFGKAASATQNNTAATQTTSKGGIEVQARQIKKGDSGNAVKSLQLILIGNGYNCGGYGADGIFGAGTEASVKAYQKAKGLAVDGIVGPDTWTKLVN